MNTLAIRVENEPPLTIITLNRPDKRNALNPQMVVELNETLLAAEVDKKCRAVMLRGEGAAFCAGMDLDVLAHLALQPFDINLEDSRRLGELFHRIWAHPKPIIAVVTGPAIAGGCGLATICDFTLATPESTFGFTEVKIGFVPAIVGVFLARVTGEKRARDLLLSGRIVSAAEAQQLGLVTEIVATDKIDARARELVAQLAANSPLALATTKRLRSAIPHDELERACAANAAARHTNDCREGLRAFLEKRKPNWT
jgi:methylglutaconyl-CoA hydratase